MLGLAGPRSVCAEPQSLLPVRRSGALLSEHGAKLSRIRSMVGVPAQHWRLLYEALFAAYAEYVQQMPVSEPLDRLESGTLLEHALDTAELALKVRRGYVLPPGKEPEVVANEQDVWTYAVATGALLRGTGKVVLEQRVTLHDRHRRPAGVWNPWTGPMMRSGNAYYSVAPRRGAESGLARSALPLLVPHILPADGLRWLADHEDALASWLASLSGHVTDVTPIEDIIGQALQPSDAALRPEKRQRRGAEPPPSESGTTAANSEDSTFRAQRTEAAPAEVDVREEQEPEGDGEGADLREDDSQVPSRHGDAEGAGEAFLRWLIDGIRSGELPVNSAKAHLHVVDAGLLLASPAVFRAFAGENWREVQKRFLKRKLTAKTARGENIFQYWQNGARGRKTIKGILLRDPEKTLGVQMPNINTRLTPKLDSR